MEDILISIDSKYRDFIKYPNESKFTLNFEKIYKNIVSAKLVSLELTNSINYISSTKNNNYVTFYFPNILNDPDGIKISINTQLQNINNIITEFNNQLNYNLLTLNSEKYFYIFYLINDCEISFDFNSNILPTILNNKLVLKVGWYSIYGINIIIQNYIQTNYNARQLFIKSNSNIQYIDLDDGNFIIYSFTLNVYDKRFTDNIRNDVFPQYNYTINNLQNFKNDFYSLYLTDKNNYIATVSGNGILDNLLNNKGSIYFINSLNTNPGNTNNMLYNLILSYDSNTLKVSFINNFNTYYYTNDNWITNTNFTNYNITLLDIPQFQIDFSTLSSNLFTNNILNINSSRYPSIGYYLGFRTLNNISLLSPILINTQLMITGSKNYNVLGEDYIFLRINDWGNFDFFNQILFSKIFLRSDLTSNNKTNNFINKEYVFSQLKTINKLDIELIDYLGNNVDLNGVDFSFTLSLRTQANIGQKQLFELQNKNF